MDRLALTRFPCSPAAFQSRCSLSTSRQLHFSMSVTSALTPLENTPRNSPLAEISELIAGASQDVSSL